jgi:hypothetical protein
MPEVKEPACSPTPPTRPAAGAAGAPADPGGNQIPGGPPIHVFPPGPTDVTLPFSGGTLQGLDVEPASSPTIGALPPWPTTPVPPPAASGTTCHRLAWPAAAANSRRTSERVTVSWEERGPAQTPLAHAPPQWPAAMARDGTSSSGLALDHRVSTSSPRPGNSQYAWLSAPRPQPDQAREDSTHGRQKAMVLRRGRQAARSAGSWTRSGPGTGRATRERTCRRRASRPCLPDRPTDSQKLAILAHSC